MTVKQVAMCAVNLLALTFWFVFLVWLILQ